MKYLKINFFLVDFGFLFYWCITYLKLIPDELLFPDYKNPTLVTWNWSFFPLDIVLSLSGIASLFLLNRKNEYWRILALVSLSLTHASGLMAISFWAIQGWFDLSWWLPNLYLVLYPIPMLTFLIRKN